MYVENKWSPVDLYFVGVDIVLGCISLYLAWLCCCVLRMHYAWPDSGHFSLVALHFTFSEYCYSVFLKVESYFTVSTATYTSTCSPCIFISQCFRMPWKFPFALKCTRFHLPQSLVWFSVHFASREQENWSELCLSSSASSVLPCFHTSSDTAAKCHSFSVRVGNLSNSRHSVVQYIIQ